MKQKRQRSTTALSKALDIPLKELFSILAAKGWIEKNKDHWSLTLTGIENGGQFVDHAVYGKYITWPDHIDNDALGLNDKSEFLTATDIGAFVDLSGRQVNAIFADLDWIKKENKGWVTTTDGTLNCGLQRESIQTGNPYVIWHKSIKDHALFKDKLKANKKLDLSEITLSSRGPENSKEPYYKTIDGHRVKTSAEAAIDNWLYKAGMVHACGIKLLVNEELYCGFFLPAQGIYIEYTGSQNTASVSSIGLKLKTYEKHKLKLIELNDKDLKNLGSVLPKRINAFGREDN